MVYNLNGVVISMDDNIAPQFSESVAYAAGDYVLKLQDNGQNVLYKFTAAHAAGAWTGTDAEAVTMASELSSVKSQINKGYDDVARIVKIVNTSTTLGSVKAILDTVNSVGDHVFFDMSALGVMMYLCTIFIDADAGVYKVFDLVSGRYAEGSYDASMLLTMATAQANGLAVQSQIDALQAEIDALGGKSVLANFDALGDKILDGTSTDIIDEGDILPINWIKTVLGTTTSGLNVSCSDIWAFAKGVGEAEASTYLFVFDGTNWTRNGETVNLTDYALNVSGTPATGEVMTIVTTVDAKLYTFVSYDTAVPCDSGVTHNWLLEQTYAPDTKAYDNYESIFCVQAGKSIPAGKYYLPLYSYRSSGTFNLCFELTEALGGSMKVQMARTASASSTRVTADGISKSDVSAPTSVAARNFGTAANLATVAITYLSTAEAAAQGYTDLTTLNTDANDPVFVAGSMDKAALGSNTWPLSNIRQWLGDDTQGDNYVPSYDNDIAAAYNRGAGFLYGIDPRALSIVQWCEVPWLCGRDNKDTPHYIPASGTAPASSAPTYYERDGEPGARTYTALDPQPAAGDDVSGYYVLEQNYIYNTLYTSEDRVFLLSMKEMAFDSNTTEGTMTQLYGDYTGDVLTNDAVADRAKLNKSGGTKNSYRWSRSALATYASYSRYVTSAGSHDGSYAIYAFYFAPAFIIGKSANLGA